MCLYLISYGSSFETRQHSYSRGFSLRKYSFVAVIDPNMISCFQIIEQADLFQHLALPLSAKDEFHTNIMDIKIPFNEMGNCVLTNFASLHETDTTQHQCLNVLAASSARSSCNVV
jgi:hypothetical protein